MKDDRTQEQRDKDYKVKTDMALEMGARKSNRSGFIIVNGQEIDLTATAPSYKWIGYQIIKQLSK